MKLIHNMETEEWGNERSSKGWNKQGETEIEMKMTQML